MQLTDNEKNRYSRHISLDKVGLSGQEKIKSAKVLVFSEPFWAVMKTTEETKSLISKNPLKKFMRFVFLDVSFVKK